MARTTQASARGTAPEPKAPDFIAWHVSNRGDKAFWTKVGAAWFHRDRKGLSLQLEVVPINGRIVLRTPLDDESKGGSRALSVRPSGKERPSWCTSLSRGSDSVMIPRKDLDWLANCPFQRRLSVRNIYGNF